ncbi:unnamed protein product [Schistosoma curassoni]|uniref:MarR family transcriptional regulator n=1 Tax=Schistosoma curassoni TaxID=6186 RepID=A0A183K960_9TREM|nr:unnamed protein product [Schistosoma curassoni]
MNTVDLITPTQSHLMEKLWKVWNLSRTWETSLMNKEDRMQT